MSRTESADRNRAAGRSSRPSPYSTWLSVAVILPSLAIVAALAWTTGHVLAWFVWAVNITAFVLYWHDKSAARKQAGRVPELVLHLLALVGATPAAMLAARLFRHKTRKWQFQVVYWLCVALHLALAAWGGAMLLSAQGWRGRVWTAFAAGLLAAINIATFVLEPKRGRQRVRVAASVLIVLGGGLGAALRDRRRAGNAWLPYLAATAQLGLALVAALVAVRAMLP